MKKILFILIMCCFINHNAFAAGNTLRFGVMNYYPPFVSTNDIGQSYGFDIAIAQAICKQTGKVCVFVPMPFSYFFPSLDAGTIDAAISAIVISKSRTEKYDFTYPYYYGHMAFLSKVNNNAVATPEGLRGKTAGTLAGTAFLDYLKENYPYTKIKTYPRGVEAMADLSKGKIDVYLIDSLHAKWWVLNGNNQFKLAGPKLPLPGNAGYGIAIKKGNTDLLNMINSALETMISNGTEAKIINLYLKISA